MLPETQRKSSTAAASSARVSSLPKPNQKWNARCVSLAAKLKVTPATVFWGIRFERDLEFFSPATRRRLEKKYAPVFAWVRDADRVLLGGKEVRRG